MNQKLSSGSTFFAKYLFVLIWSGGFGFGVLQLFAENNPDKMNFFYGWLLGTFSIIFWTHNLKKVELSDSKLIVSNYIKTIEIPVSNITDVSRSIFTSNYKITIHFKQPTEFGTKIVFMPKTSFSAPHSTYEKLKELIG